MLSILLTIGAKSCILANELKILSRLAEPVFAAGTDLVVEAEFNVALAGYAKALVVPAKLGIWAAMLLDMLSIEGGAEGAERVDELGAEPPMVVANPANDGMLVAMMSVMLVRVGKTTPPSAGGASSLCTA